MDIVELRVKCEASTAGDSQAAATLVVLRERDAFKAYWDACFKDLLKAQESAQRYLCSVYHHRLALAILMASHPCYHETEADKHKGGT